MAVAILEWVLTGADYDGVDQQLELVERPCWGRKATRVPLARRRGPCRAG